MARHARSIPLRLDARVAEEKAILDRYDMSIPGRRVDYLRGLLIAGYRALNGKAPPPTMFDAPEQTKHVVDKSAHEGVSTHSSRPLQNSEENQQKPLADKAQKVSFAGLAGNQL